MKKALLVLTISGLVFFANDTFAGNSNGCQGNCPTTGDGGSNTASVGNTKATGGNATGGSVGNTKATGGDATGGNVGDTSASGGNATGGSVGNTKATGGSVGNTKATGGNVGDTSSTSQGGSSVAQGGAGGSVGDTTSTSTSNANVGDTTSSSTVGDTTSMSNNDNTSSVGDTTSESNNSNDSEGGDVEFNYDYVNVQADNAASSAASILTSYCQSGASAQGFTGGFSLTGNDLFCDRIRMADYYWIQYERQVQLSVTFQCSNPVPALKDRCSKTGKRMITSLDKAWENTEKANSLLNSGQFASKVERAVGPLGRIGGILALLVAL